MKKFFLIAVGLGLIFIGYLSVFTVTQIEQALVIQFGEHKRTEQDPGLKFKYPWQNVIFLDKRILNLDLKPEEIVSSDQKRMVVDAIARFRIVDPLLTFQTRRNEVGVAQALVTMVSSSVREVLAREQFLTLLSGERATLMRQIRDSVNAEAQTLGVAIIDVRLRRVDLPVRNSQSIYERMNTARKQEADEIRAEGQEQAQRIRAQAERERTVLLANAERDSQILRGEGDGKAVSIFADAYNKDKDFFEFYRSMQAYRKALGRDDTTLVLSPNSEFFKYFKDMDGGG